MISVYRSIELLALRRAFAYGDVTWEAGVLAACHTLIGTPMHDPAEPELASEAFVKMQAAFHTALLRACNSPCLLELWQLMYDALAAHRRRCTNPLPSNGIATTYQAVTKAVLARDVDVAVELLAQCDPFPTSDAGS